MAAFCEGDISRLKDKKSGKPKHQDVVVAEVKLKLELGEGLEVRKLTLMVSILIVWVVCLFGLCVCLKMCDDEGKSALVEEEGFLCRGGEELQKL